MDVETGGGSAIQGDAPAGRDFIGRDTDNRHQEINFRSNDDSRTARLEAELNNLKALTMTRFLIAESQRETMKDEIRYLRDERNDAADLATKQFWIAIIVSLITVATMLYFIWTLNNTVKRLSALQPAVVVQASKR